MSNEELTKLIEKASWSGWPRHEAAKLVIRLCEELKKEKETNRLLLDAVRHPIKSSLGVD